MTKAEQYLILKPISERFNKVANEMSDEEVKQLITSTLKEKIQDELESIDFGYAVQEVIETYVENCELDILTMIKTSLLNKFK